ncbi:Acg family FMN-binding oxidoreductase [Actinomadura sp. SCN-SB]|uniref:Acg family FMN-binding oxidoreductase n=1 Tax=Actinomadura sp. SCN-SB TaxID=3373092 RepID=UPI0037535D54
MEVIPMVSAIRPAAGRGDTVSRRVRAGQAARFVVRAAILAPSAHNTQPWRFIDRPSGLELWADPSRRLRVADAAGREMVISCGAALFNARLAVRHLGFTPRVRLLPDPAHPDLLARITWGARTAPRPYEESLYRAMRHRHTHRGPFLTTALPPTLPTVLAGIARHEGAGLRIVHDDRQRALLEAHVQVAQAIQRLDARFSGELDAWAAPGRDHAAGSPWGFPLPAGRRDADRPVDPRAVGTVAVLTTREDRRTDWLLAGQALQHVLLHAATAQVSAAFHTQPLELPYLRTAVRRDLGCGHPQMVLRLGHTEHSLPSSRRPVTDVLSAKG